MGDPTVQTAGADAACSLCRMDQTHPHLMICRHQGWSLAHIHDFLPLGTVMLIPDVHLLATELTAPLWRDAAELMELVPRMLTDCAMAQRVYMLSFSEFNNHYHLVFLPKTDAMQREHAGKVAIPLLGELLSREPLPVDGVLAAVHNYRTYLARRLARASVAE